MIGKMILGQECVRGVSDVGGPGSSCLLFFHLTDVISSARVTLKPARVDSLSLQPC